MEGFGVEASANFLSQAKEKANEKKSAFTLCRTQKLSRDDSGRREKEPFERPFFLSTHFTAPRAGAVAAADEQSAAEQRRAGQLMHAIEKLSR